MFYSQFILAKKGPLGTIWIAAHLERKLRKNQVADTDIGVSVGWGARCSDHRAVVLRYYPDSILFPDVPIALRLSSHLLLGVVRIYSRKVNYLFDDCSEALLKIKQAFRSTAVDLPPEESTAPYHSITLPETFDLDDFELPDNEMFQGNYVDHHVSAREQITLQDTMEGVVYSTSQFGLDERFGDGDTSQIGLDLDEDLFLGKVASQGNDEVLDDDLLASAPPMTPEEIEDIHEGISRTSEIMDVDGFRDQIEIPAANIEAVGHAQATSSPLFVEHASLSKVQGPLTFDGCLESNDHGLLESEAMEDAENPISKYDAHETVAPSEENGYLPSEVEMNQAKSQGHSPPIPITTENISADNGLSTPSAVVEQVKSTPLVPECSNVNISATDGPIRVEDIHNGVVINEPTTHPVDGTYVQCAESPRVRLDEIVASPSCSQVTTELEDPGRRTCSIDVETHNTGESCSPSNALVSNVVCPSDSPGRPEVVNAEAQTFQEPNKTDTSNHSTQEHMASDDLPVLRPCNTQKEPDVSSVRGDGSHSTDVLNLGSEKKQLSEPALCEETPNDCRKSDEEMDNVASCDNQMGNLERSAALDLPAPEKLLSVSDGLSSKPNDLLVESTPRGDEGGAGIKLTSGKKRSFTESNLTVHSLNSSDSFSMTRLKRTAESIPDDDDLLSSILVGRKSSVLKMKPTPPAPEIISSKRLRSAPRASTSKRKVLMDDMMVLHGDTIRQQLTNTEDIRRMRKKAPCTRPEISMIQKQFLEEEIFIEPIFTGMSTALIFLHHEAFDVSRIMVSENDQDNGPIELAKDVESSVVVRSDTEKQTVNIPTQSASQPAEREEFRSQQENLGEVVEMEIDGRNNEVADVANLSVNGLESSFQINPVSNDLANDLPENTVQTDLVDKSNEVDASVPMDTSCMSPQNLETEQVEDTSLADTSNVRVNAIEDNGHDADMSVDLEKDNGNLHASVGAPSVEAGEHEITTSGNGDQHVEVNGNNDLNVLNPDEVQALDLGCEYKDLTSGYVHAEEDKVDSSHSLELDVDAENTRLNIGENADFLEIDPPSATNAAVTAESSAIEYRGDFEDVTVGNDTEFLNVDDDEVEVDYDDNMPGAEDTRLLDNSGWSSRTRAVAKYLQTLFDKEPQNGKRPLPMDNLLTGKTRKEASRMFFETLVLKTKDYINVEQVKPFDNINVKPRIKLMKSDF
ncbi:Rad21/Rec8-like protein [Parasponia andersonii]|uniref:Rad21/Rec8-like protein n=1 Tax=Parasponia andersonii TaxID=3476 RepID=A0A2P5C320_PARAD|nr:Rad21/Rec8-like protein [Parasponia andersonii]